ncbi:hypothetical protein BOTBODRAFT_632573, partial [Botryobasidium botryosum FD-172 SS1]
FDRVKIRNVDIPVPEAGKVLVKVYAVSLQYRDISVALGEYPLPTKENVIPCSDMAGKIAALGEGVTGWKVGERVCANFSLDHIDGAFTPEMEVSSSGAVIDGVLAQYQTFPARSLVRIPRHLSYVEASTLPCAGVTAWNSLFGAERLRKEDTVLVQGTGGVSIFALQFAAAYGSKVIVTSSSDDKLERAKASHAAAFINYARNPNWDEEVQKITKGRGVKHLIEVGGVATIKKSVQSIGYGGWIHSVGFLTGDDINITLEAIVRLFNLRGIRVGSVAQFNDLMAFLEVKELHPVVDKVFPFEEAQAAYRYLSSGAHFGKVVIEVAKE